MSDGLSSSHVRPRPALAWVEPRPSAFLLPTDRSKNVTFLEHYPLLCLWPQSSLLTLGGTMEPFQGDNAEISRVPGKLE